MWGAFLRFQVEKFIDVFPEMAPMFEAQFDELATLKQHIRKIDPDLELYAHLEATNKLHVVIARENNELAGYFVGVVTPHPHYKSTLMCSADLYYMSLQHRKAQNGILFIQAIERSLKARGVQLMVMGTKLSKNLGFIYDHLGYKETDHVWRKWIGE